MDLVLAIGDFVRDIDLFGLTRVVDICLVAKQIGNAVERSVLADGEFNRGDTGSESILQVRQGVVERGPFLVEFVDENHPRYTELLCDSPGVLGLYLDTLCGVDHEDGEIDNAEGGMDISDEIGVAGGVDEVDLVPHPLEGCQCQAQRHVASVLLRIEIGDRVALLDGSQALDRAGAVQQGFSQRCLACAGMPNQGDVADLFRGKHVHYPASRVVVGGMKPTPQPDAAFRRSLRSGRARVAKPVDAAVLNTAAPRGVGVRIPPRAPKVLHNTPAAARPQHVSFGSTFGQPACRCDGPFCLQPPAELRLKTEDRHNPNNSAFASRYPASSRAPESRAAIKSRSRPMVDPLACSSVAFPEARPGARSRA